MPDTERLLIVRFSPFTAEGCRRNAVDTFEDDLTDGREPPRYGVSAFGTVVERDGPVDAALVRLCKEAPVGGKNVSVVWADELELRGFRVLRDEPPLMHYLVGQGDLSELPDFVGLALLWADHRVQNPAWEKR